MGTPVLMYHEIGYSENYHPYSVDEGQFEAQLQFSHKNGFKGVISQKLL